MQQHHVEHSDNLVSRRSMKSSAEDSAEEAVVTFLFQRITFKASFEKDSFWIKKLR